MMWTVGVAYSTNKYTFGTSETKLIMHHIISIYEYKASIHINFMSSQTYEDPNSYERAPSATRSRPRRRFRDDRRERSHSRHSLSSDTRVRQVLVLISVSSSFCLPLLLFFLYSPFHQSVVVCCRVGSTVFKAHLLNGLFYGILRALVVVVAAFRS